MEEEGGSEVKLLTGIFALTGGILSFLFSYDMWIQREDWDLNFYRATVAYVGIEILIGVLLVAVGWKLLKEE